MGVAPNPFVSLDAVDCLFLAPDMFAPCTRKADHFLGFMGVAHNQFFVGLDAVDCEFVAPDMFAPRTPEVDHLAGFMLTTTSRLLVLGAEDCESLAPDMFAPLTRDVEESTSFAVHRATCRRLPFPAITRLFLFWETFLAICHTIDLMYRYRYFTSA